MRTLSSRDNRNLCAAIAGSLGVRCGRDALAIVVVAVLSLSAPTLVGSSDSQKAPVRGEVILLTAELVVVKSADGTSILIPLSKNAKLDPQLKVGDQAEVVVAQDHEASVLLKLSQEPRQ